MSTIPSNSNPAAPLGARTTSAKVRWLLGHWKTYGLAAPMLMSLTLANAALLVSYPYLLRQIIEGIGEDSSPAELLRLAGLMMGIGLAHFAVYFTMQLMRVRHNLRFEFSVRLRAFEHVLRRGPSFFTHFRTGDVVTRLLDDVSDKLAWFMCSGIFRVLEALAIILFGMAMMLSINPRLTLYAAGPLPVLVALFVITAQRLHRRYTAVQESISALNNSLESCFSGIRVVKAFGAEAWQRELVEQAVERQRRAELRAVRWQTVIDSLYGNVWQLGVVAVLVAGGGMVIAGDIKLGDMVAFDGYVLLLVGPMFDVGQFLVRGKLSAVAVERISELEAFPPEPADAEVPPPVDRRPQDAPPTDYPRAAGTPLRGVPVRFESVSYRFPGAEGEALIDVSFAALPGQLTALVGEVGSGKSTVLSLIPRLTDPTSGRVVIGERDLRDWNVVAARQAIGFAPQEPSLLSGTLRENVRFGREWISNDDVMLAVEVSQLASDLARWSEGLETVIGSHGIRLSGGQKQRVALARAIAGRPAILLLDDCTASLDAETEEAVWKRLATMVPDCTTILVTHRPATLKLADQIVVLDRGRIHEVGHFDELNRRESLFHELYVRWKLREETE